MTAAVHSDRDAVHELVAVMQYHISIDEAGASSSS
jgi:hypothetical protein